LIPYIYILLAPRETIQQVPASKVILFHFLLNKLNQQFAWHKFAFFHASFYLLAFWASIFDSLSQEISSRQMPEAVFFHHELALSELLDVYVPLPDPGPPKTKNTSAGGSG
jgi:hypothetical protein